MAAHQAPSSLGFSRQEHWSGLPFPSPMHESEKWKWSCSVVSDSSRPHGLQPTRRLHPRDFQARVLEWVTTAFSKTETCYCCKSRQSCPTLCDPIDGSPPGSSVCGILQARILESVAISFSMVVLDTSKWARNTLPLGTLSYCYLACQEMLLHNIFLFALPVLRITHITSKRNKLHSQQMLSLTEKKKLLITPEKSADKFIVPSSGVAGIILISSVW